MGYGNHRLTIDTLTEACMVRLADYKNSKGEVLHKKEDGSDWIPSQWFQALVGEVGEFANKRKKFERGDMSFEDFEVHAKKEMADIMCYLVILSRRCLDAPDCIDEHGIDLSQAIVDKFNEVSDRVGSRVILEHDDWHFRKIGIEDRPDL